MSVLSLFLITIVVSVVTALVLGVRAVARRALPPAEARVVVRRAIGFFAVWLGTSAVVAATGVLRDFDARPPRLMILVVASFAVLTIVTRTARFKALLAATPPSWPVALMSMRVPIEIGLWGLFATGKLPVHMTFEGRNFDVLVGATAPVVAWALARGKLGRAGLVAWNVASLGLLANIVGMAVTTIPGPLHLPWPGVSNTVVADFPWVWLPTFLVPVAVFGHVVSLRQVLAGRVSSSRAPA